MAGVERVAVACSLEGGGEADGGVDDERSVVGVGDVGVGCWKEEGSF
jgi:hypothetical protein